jgi:hypothetical protein
VLDDNDQEVIGIGNYSMGGMTMYNWYDGDIEEL